MWAVFGSIVKSALDIYSISFKGLSLGKHSFNFVLDDAFFHEFEEGEVKHGQLNVDVVLFKQNHLMEFGCSIKGTVEVTCDRCLEPFSLPISYKGTLYVKVGADKTDVDDDIILLTEEEHEINLAQYFYESTCLSIPISRYHGLNGTKLADCDAEMLARMSNETDIEAEQDSIDPRWAKLQEISKN